MTEQLEFRSVFVKKNTINLFFYLNALQKVPSVFEIKDERLSS